MDSKEHLLNVIAKVGYDRQEYFTQFFKYMPELIAKEIVYTEVQKDDYILMAGDPCDTVYIILKGQVVGFDYQKMGRVYSFMDFTKMYILGDFEVFGGFSEYSVSLRAAEVCKLLKISKKSYLNWIQHDENALFLRLRNIVNTLSSERKLDREYVFMGCKERLINYLTKIYEKENNKDYKCFKIEKTQAEMADKIGFNIRSVQRSIASLKKEGFISTQNGKITISHEQYLRLNQWEGKKGKE